MEGSPVPRPLSRWVFPSLVLIYLLAVGVRLGVWYEMRDDPTYQVPVGDMKGNHEFAEQVVKGTLPPNAYYKAPLYGYLLAIIYWMGGVDAARARFVQIVLTSLSPVLTFLIARRLFGSPADLIAGLLGAVFWTFVFFSTELLDTAWAGLFYLLLAWLLVTLDDRKASTWLLCGLVLGVGAITRPNILSFAPVLAVVVGVVAFVRGHRAARAGSLATASGGSVRGPLRRAIIHMMALTLGCCAAVFPVTLRNRMVAGEWVLIGWYGGLNLYVANSPYSDSKDGPLLVPKEFRTAPWRIDHKNPEPWARNCLNYNVGMQVGETRLGRIPKPGEAGAVLSQMAKDFLLQNPAWFARHALMRFCWMFNMYEYQSNRDLQELSDEWGPFKVLRYMHFGYICPLVVVGLVTALLRSDLRTSGMAYYIAMLASLFFPAVLFIINCRFRTPLVQLMIPLAAFGLLQVVGLFRSGVSWGRRGFVGVLVVGVGVLSNANVFDYWSSCKGHLRAQYVGACERAGRTDLIDRAYDDLETTLEQEMKDLRPGNTSLMLEYGRYMARLFIRNMQKGRVQQALHFGRLMIEHERLQGDVVSAYMDVLIKTRDTQQASWTLDMLRKRCASENRDILAASLLQYGRYVGDRSMLDEAAGIYRDLAQRDPTNAQWQEGLRRAEAAVNVVSTTRSAGDPASTRPAKEGPR